MSHPQDNASKESARVKQFNRNKWFFSLGGIGRDMSYALVGTFLLTYLQFGVSMTLAQFTTLSLLIGVLGRVWDAVNDPVMGSLIENSHFKWGKFKPWIFIGALFTGVCILLMFNGRFFTGWAFVAYMIAVYLLWEMAYTMNDIGYWSMLPSLTSVKKERDQVSMLTVAFAAVGAIITNGIFSLFAAGNVVKTYSFWSVVIVAVFIALQSMTAFCCKETKLPAAPKPDKKEKVSISQVFGALKKNDQALWSALALLLYYISNGLLVALAYNLYYIEVGYNGNVFYFVVVYGISNIFANFLYPLLAKHLPRKKILWLSCLIASIGYLFIFALGWFDFLPFNLLTFSIFGLFVFASNTSFYMATMVNFTNCVEYNEYLTGERNEALISTLRPFVAKMSDAIKYGIQILVLVASGVYLLSQNISAIETQKNFFSDLSTEDQIAYVERVQHYLSLYEKGTSEEDINAALEEDEVLKNYQITAAGLPAIGDCHLFFIKTVDGVSEKSHDIAKLRDIDATELLISEGDTSYTYELMIAGEDAQGNGFNAGDEHFRDKVRDNIGARLALRFAVCILPVILLVAAYLIQKKKFIIDEEYYDTILTELSARHSGDTEAVEE